jgi:hypothetical protein
MVTLFTPGKALGCNVNAHRMGWNGTVCSDPSNWSCSAEQSFRESYCERGDPRCYHVHLFDERQARFQIDDNGIGWMLHVDDQALDDQILVIWGGDFAEPRGLKEKGPTRGPMYGAYRIKSSRKIELPYRVVWEVIPHPDGWTRCHNLRVPRPSNRALSGKYMREVDRGSLLSAFDEGQRVIDEQRDVQWFAPGDAARFQHFRTHLEEWLESARKAAESRGGGRHYAPPATVRMTTGPASASPLANLRSVVPASALSQDKPRPATPARPPEPSSTSDASVRSAATPDTMKSTNGGIEPGGQKHIVETYGEDTLLALRVAVMTKPLLILRGNTGVGKSHLALRLIDDPNGERSLVVPVAATWRGRDDLLGYVNPITAEFEPTRFTTFLHSAWKAWQTNDRRTRLVVFEEFNLSQPEHWMSDLLVISQFDDARQRRIELGGKGIRGLADAEPAVILSPAVRFVATINSDHTTRPLSPRVIDRAAVVELDIEPREALRLANAQVDDDQLLPITELDEALRSRGASFSLRSARSLSSCLAHLQGLGITPWQALDMVLVQEVLSKVRLFARDPSDADLLKDLQRWSEKHGRNLARCSKTIEAWHEALANGSDVVQA